MNIQQLLQMLSGGQPQLGSGMAEQARQILESRPYQLHLQESQAMGVEPMSPEEFLEFMKQGQQTQQQFNSAGQFGGLPR